MTPERLSIILEVLSFFLITTDLYGKERLKILRDNIISKKDILDEKSVSPFSIFFIILITGVVIVTIVYNLWVADIIAMKYYQEYDIINWIFVIAIFLFLLYIGFKYGYNICFYIVGALYYILTSITLVILKYILKIFPIEGIFLFIGTIMFIVSKIIIF